MSTRRIAVRWAAVCLGASGLMALTLASTASAQGNSQAAHKCQKGGFNSLVGTEGQTFTNTGACVEYAANGGKFATGIIIPKGHTATLSDGRFSADDALAYGYQLNFGANVELASKPQSDGETVLLPEVTLGPYPTAELLRIWLTDNYGPEFEECPAFTFYSDELHGLVSGSNPFLVEIADGAFCTSPPSEPRQAGNLVVTVTVN